MGPQNSRGPWLHWGFFSQALGLTDARLCPLAGDLRAIGRRGNSCRGHFQPTTGEGFAASTAVDA